MLIGKASTNNNNINFDPIIRSSLNLVFIFSIPLSIFYIFSPLTLVHWYIKYSSTLNFDFTQTVKPIFWCFAFLQIIDGIRIILASALRGFQDTKRSMQFSFLTAIFFSLPVIYFSTIYWHGGINWLLGTLLVSMSINVVLLYYSLRTYIHRRMSEKLSSPELIKESP